MANPSGNHQDQTHVSSSFNNGNLSNGNSAPEPSAVAATVLAMKHDPGIAVDWTPEEHALLEEGLTKYASEPNLTRYVKIALGLQNKTVRDVALRVRWMNKKENSKKRKDDHNLTRKSKDKKERVSDASVKSSQFAAQPNVSPYAPAMAMMDNDDGISCEAIGGPTGDLLEQNAQSLNQISTNLASFQFQENLQLFCQTRDNIMKLLAEVNDNVPDVMKHMPFFPYKISESIANAILPKATPPMQ